MSEKNTLEPIAGEEGMSPVSGAKKPGMNAKVFFGMALVCVLIVGVATLLVTRYEAKRKAESSDKQSSSQATTASNAGAQPLKITDNAAGVPPAIGGVQPKVAPQDTHAHLGDANPLLVVPAIVPDAIDVAPIGVRASGASSNLVAKGASGNVTHTSASSTQAIDPFDAPILLTPAPALGSSGRASSSGVGSTGYASDAGLDDAMSQTRARLDETRARLEQQLASMPGTKTSMPSAASGPPATAKPAATDDGLKMSSTARVGAARLVAPMLTLPRGMTFTCALASRIISEQTGPVSCVVARNVYGHDGRVLLIERGSHLDGAYHAQIKVGQTRVAVVWERLRMPNGVVVDLASPATGPLGEAGVDGFVDNHWTQRIGAALLLSILDDAVKIDIAREQAKGAATGAVILQGSGTETSTLAGKVLDTTVNIPPTVIKNQGEIVAVNVAQDIDFSTVYELHASKL